MTATGQKFQPWSDDELDILRREYPVGGAKSCVPLLPKRTYNAIQLRASSEGLASPVADDQVEEPIDPITHVEALKRDISESRRALTAAENRYALALRNYALHVSKQRRDHVHQRKVA